MRPLLSLFLALLCAWPADARPHPKLRRVARLAAAPAAWAACWAVRSEKPDSKPGAFWPAGKACPMDTWPRGNEPHKRNAPQGSPGW